MTWRVGFSSKAAKQAGRLPFRESEKMAALLQDLETRGPVLPEWKNYSKLGKDMYHCHLSYKWVACWKVEDERLKLIEIYYAGSRENAPY